MSRGFWLNSQWRPGKATSSSPSFRQARRPQLKRPAAAQASAFRQQLAPWVDCEFFGLMCGNCWREEERVHALFMEWSNQERKQASTCHGVFLCSWFVFKGEFQTILLECLRNFTLCPSMIIYIPPWREKKWSMFCRTREGILVNWMIFCCSWRKGRTPVLKECPLYSAEPLPDCAALLRGESWTHKSSSKGSGGIFPLTDFRNFIVWWLMLLRVMRKIKMDAFTRWF